MTETVTYGKIVFKTRNSDSFWTPLGFALVVKEYQSLIINVGLWSSQKKGDEGESYEFEDVLLSIFRHRTKNK